MAIIFDGHIDSGLIVGDNYRLQNEYIYSGTSQSWTFTGSNMSLLTFEAWGGGGAGGSSSDNAGGGGGGAYALTNIYTPVSGTVYTLTVGAGGVADTVSVNITHGGPTSVSGASTVYVLAQGGDSNLNVSGGADGGGADTCTGDIKYSGGRGGNGWQWNGGAGPGVEADYYSGPGGGGAGSTGDGNDANNATFAVNPGFAAGKDELGGKGGAARNAGDSAGYPGTAYGGGGGGASNFDATGDHDGGAGAKGLIRIRWYG